VTPIRPEKLPEGMIGNIIRRVDDQDILQVECHFFRREHIEHMAEIGWKLQCGLAFGSGPMLLAFIWHPTPEMTNEKP